MIYRKLLFVPMLLVLCTASSLTIAQDHSGVIFLLRHADKAADTKDALLSPQGHKRAACLAQMLGEAGIRAILVTNIPRTQQTAEPLAKKLGVTPTILQQYDIDSFVKKLQTLRNENVVVVGHADTVPNIVEKLGGGKISIENADYDKLFVFHYDSSGNKGRVTMLRYCDCN